MGSTGLVGMIGGSLEDFWHQEFAAELQRCLRRHGRHMLLADAGGDADAEIALAQSLSDQRVDGLVALPVDPGSSKWLPIVRAVPTVAVGAPLRRPRAPSASPPTPPSASSSTTSTRPGITGILLLATVAHRPPRRPALARCAAASRRPTDGARPGARSPAATGRRRCSRSRTRSPTACTWRVPTSDSTCPGTSPSPASTTTPFGAGRPAAHKRELGHGGRGGSRRVDAGQAPSTKAAGAASSSSRRDSGRAGRPRAQPADVDGVPAQLVHPDPPVEAHGFRSGCPRRP